MSSHSFDRLLFVLRPPVAVADHIDRERSHLGPGKPVRTDYLHVTLGLVDFPLLPSRAVSAMREIGETVATGAFRIAMDRVTGTGRSVALRPSERIEQLHRLREQLATGMSRMGLAPARRRPFRPHITLLYRHGAPFDREVDIVSWTVDDFLLIHSRVGLTEHIVLERWPLLCGSGQGR